MIVAGTEPGNRMAMSDGSGSLVQGAFSGSGGDRHVSRVGTPAACTRQLGGTPGDRFRSHVGLGGSPSSCSCWREAARLGSLVIRILVPFRCSVSRTLSVTGKNISFLAASASRAAIHNVLAAKGNLADVTAKAGAQTILACMVGESNLRLVGP